jgi:hypothetical protein
MFDQPTKEKAEMKRAWILACSLAFVATAGLAETLSDASVALAAVLELPTAPSACPTYQHETIFAASSVVKATCTASCGSGTVSCTYTPPSVCTAVDRDCSSGQRGYVTCNGVTTYCGPTCQCTEGSIRFTGGSGCCGDPPKKMKQQEKCIDGQWVPQDVFICIGLC